MTGIRFHRETKGLPLKKVAEITGISPVSLWRYENGKRQPRAGELKKIADVLGVTTDELLKDNSECD